jgi:hypothetical protein
LRGAKSYDALRDEIDGLSDWNDWNGWNRWNESLAIALFNQKLLGRAQVWAEVSSQESGVGRPENSSLLTPCILILYFID